MSFDIFFKTREIEITNNQEFERAYDRAEELRSRSLTMAESKELGILEKALKEYGQNR